MEPEQYLVTKLRQLNIELTDKQICQFMKYYELLIEKNKVMNLTAITEFESVVIKHFVDSLAVIGTDGFKSVYRMSEKSDGTTTALVDLGTGAGFPGIPLKIVFPHLRVMLVDSLNKRILFLQEVIDKINLKDICAVHGRAEELGRDKKYRDQFDLCVSRAVANMATLSEYCLPFVKPGGRFICYKSANAAEEIKSAKRAIGLLCGEIEETARVMLPDTDILRTFIVIKKTEITPGAYPRKAGVPTKKPL